jgi:hypothetical protein
VWTVGLLLACLLTLRAETNDSPRPWPEYRTILWIGDTVWKQPDKLPLFFQRMRELGINTAMVFGEGNPQPFLDQHFSYYVENLVNRGLCLKFNSKVTDWNKFVTDWAATGRPESALVRDYCLDDPQWRQWGRHEVQTIALKNRDHQPLAYNLRDELSTTISANPFDYDFSPLALAGFRDWLKTQYGGLADLNAEWETRFASWDEVKPFTTDEIKNRMGSGEAAPRGRPDWQQVQALRFDPLAARQSPTRWNFAPWADFRSYMDLSLARALADFREAARAIDPRTPVGIEGTQMPNAFGGYDLWRLSRVLDWAEPYDIGGAREILGSFMPGKPLLTTVFESDAAHARRRLWHLLLEGDRGCLVWWSEDCLDWNSADYRLTPKGMVLAPVMREMTLPLARLFLRARRDHDPIFLHYSQPSIQVDWLMESTVDGSTWLRRFSSFEADYNRMAAARVGWLKLLQDLGYSPQFLSAEQIETGALRATNTAALVLSGSWAMSDAEAAEVRSFLTRSPEAKVLADGTPGLFDAHGKLRGQGALESLFAPAYASMGRCVGGKTKPGLCPGEIWRYAADRLRAAPDPAWPVWLASQLEPPRPEISVPAAARVRIHRFTLGSARLVAFERNIDYQMSEELKQAGGNEALEKPIEIEAKLANSAHIYDLRTGKHLGRADRIRFTLDPWEPSLFALTAEPLPAGDVIQSLDGASRPPPLSQ